MLVPCEDGKEFIGNPFKITTSVRDVPASAASLSEGLPQFFSVFGSGGSRVWLAISGGRPQRSHALRSGLAGPLLFGTRTLKASGHLSFVLPSGMLLKLHENVMWMISEAGRSSSLFVLV